MTIQLPKQMNYLEDDWYTPEQTLQHSLCNANTGEELGAQLSSSPAQVEKAIHFAHQAFTNHSWSQLPYDKRADYLDKIAENLVDYAEDIANADAIQTGVLHSLTSKFGVFCGLAFKGAAAMLRELDEEVQLTGDHNNAIIMERLPLGVAAIIAPWNAPSGIACHKLASALAAGCPVIFKPSEWAAGSAQYIAKAIVDANLPKGVFQMVLGNGAVGAQIVNDDRVAAVSFTGGAQGGEAVGKACGANIKPAQLELGGNNALVVLADADLETAADGVITGLTTLNAQWCRALGRLVIAESIADEFLAIVKRKFAEIKLGSSLDESATMGPLIHQAHLEHVKSRVKAYQSLGGELIQGTPLPENLTGWFHVPTLITGLTSEQALEETFGPVATVHTFNNDSEATELANATVYGLAAYVFGEETHAWKVARTLRSGVVKINNVSLFALRHDLPRAAWGKSGLGDEGTKETFEFFRGTRVIGVA